MLVLALLASACGGGDDSATTQEPWGAPGGIAVDRLEQIAAEVDAWAASSTLEEARGHAEAAANLVVGPGGLGYGDRDGDGEVAGAVAEGFLPGPSGTPPGIVLDTFGTAECVRRDVLGGDWDDPVGRWSVLAAAIDEWAPDNNTFPSLPSHPMRIVGWATLTQTASFETVIEYAGHAGLHVAVSRESLARC